MRELAHASLVGMKSELLKNGQEVVIAESAHRILDIVCDSYDSEIEFMQKRITELEYELYQQERIA